LLHAPIFFAAAKKIGACNKALNLPETDGLSN